MHPRVVIGEHGCSDAMLGLITCHESGVFARFTGHCNDAAAALDKCLRANKKLLVSGNLAEAREKRRRWEELCAEQGLDMGYSKPGGG
ncbi:hypothetical protein T492DRAFT_962895 [Pavlovales sp. CCMP2436]|nr:hypothetical protein T492DRAFT_962895 [Pavlovales sp. CCMP2436]